ncbi:MAG: hypothetical protein U9P72_03410 [Campylobacterota bacterium]|nr:hypothetical protein [Campylobacterota bacterium]
MLDIDLMVAFVIMVLLFVRQIQIIKEENRINYAPVILGVGVISAVIHFIINPDVIDNILLFRESLFPLVISLFLYLVMNLIHQTKQTQYLKTQDKFTQELVTQITQLKEFIHELEHRMNVSNSEDKMAQDKIMAKFQEDIKALDIISINQASFLEKFDEMQLWHKDVSKAFKHFTEVQMPELDNIVHKHIDILRIAEQDHYNQLKKLLEKAMQSRSDISADVEKLKEDINSIKTISDTIASSIIKTTMQQLSSVTLLFEKEILNLKSHTESIETSLFENENIIGTIRKESELVMKQMILSSNKMTEISKQNSGLYNTSQTIKELMLNLELIKTDYIKSQAQLNVISKEFQLAENQQINEMQIQIENLSEILAQRIDDSLTKLHEHYHIADEDISKSVQLLAKRAQLKTGYSQTNT